MTATAPCTTPAVPERLRQAARRLGPPPEAPGPVTDYDWSRPHHFTAGGRRRLEAFALRLQDRLNTALAHVLRTKAGLVADPPAECYPSAVDDGAGGTCYVPLRDADGHPCGALRLPASLAAAWVERLLGGTPSARGGAENLSPLEAGLLLDIASWIAQAVSDIASVAGTTTIQHEPTVTGWGEALPADDGTELCSFVFREADAMALPSTPPASADTAAEDGGDTGADPAAEEASDNAGAEAASDDADSPAAADEGTAPPPAEVPPAPALLLTSRFLEPLAEADPAARSPEVDPDTFRSRVQTRIEAVPVTVVARVGSASIPLGDFLSLEAGDVVLLDRSRGETIDLTVDGQVVLRARPAVSAGYYAVEVQDLRRHPRLELAV